MISTFSLSRSASESSWWFYYLLLKKEKRMRVIHILFIEKVMPAVGLEPTRGCPQQILSLPRLPFRHTGLRYQPLLILP